MLSPVSALRLRSPRGALFLLALMCGLTALAPPRTARAKPAPKQGALADQLLADRPGLYIPEALKPWVGWVLNEKESALCPPDHGADADGVCTWPSRLSLALRDKGGTFWQSFRVYRADWVPLAGSDKLWPHEVRVDGKPAVVVATDANNADDNSAPAVFLTVGEHVLTGSFLWDELPESLPVPPSTGLVTLSVNGKAVPNPSREQDGQLYLHKEVEEEGEEVLEIRVNRKVTDDIPLTLTTQLSLRVAGKSREVTLGKALPAGFIPLSLDGGLPARVEADSRLRVQVRPGTYELTLLARHEGSTDTLSRPAPDGQWPADEIWAFAAQPELRVVTVEGVTALDPQQTNLPSEWKGLPAFSMHLGDVLKLRQERRGDANPAPDRLHLSRQLWLDFDGGALTAHDRISGTLSRTWRLEEASPAALGHVNVGGADQVITRGSSGQPGIELRQGQVNLAADSRIPRAASQLAAVSWDADFASAQISLQLPPGWRLLYASGADEVPDTWVDRYTLLDLFVVLLLTMAIGRLFGIGWGVAALVALGLACTEPGSPRWSVLAVLVAEALSRVLPAGALSRLLGLLRLGTRIVLAVILIGFVTKQVQHGLHPALENGDTDISERSEEIPDWLKKERRESENSGGRRARSDEGKMGLHEDPKTKSKNKAYAIRGPADNADLKLAKEAARDAARSAGVLGLKGDEPEKPVESQPDSFTLGMVGDGQGGGGTGEGTIGLGNLGTIGRGSGGNEKRAADKPRPATTQSTPQLQNNAFEIDPNAQVQTGPGTPHWEWTQAQLRFSGPVKRDQVVHLYLVPPWLTCALLVGQALLLLLVGMRLCGITRALLRPRAVATAVLLLGLLGGPAARADGPSDQLLEKLQEQVLKQPSCRPSCAAIGRLQLDAAPRSLRLRMEVAVAASSAVPLPGSPEQWLPAQVLVDGKPASALRLNDEHLWLALAQGNHVVVLEGPLPGRDTVQLALPLKPHRVDSQLKGWQLDGVHEDGVADDDLQLSRVASEKDAKQDAAVADEAGGLKPSTLPPYVLIERELQLGRKWQVATRVMRKSAAGSAVVLEVPLLPGESVTTAEVRVQNGKALVNMGPTVTELSWQSLLTERPRIELIAPTAVPWSETWRLSISPMFHVELSGVPVIHQQDTGGLRQPQWRPWPGEKVTIDVTRPDGIAGRTLTIDRSELVLQPGLRATDATLALDLRTSRGGPHPIGLPPAAQLLSVEINGKAQPLQSQNDRLTLNLLPGAQHISIKFQLAHGIATMYQTPAIDLGAPSVNTSLRLQLGNGRWVLYTFGPRLGPAVMIYGLLLVLALLSLVLGRAGGTPLRGHHYFLLGLGLTQVPVTEGAIVVGWLLALGYRQRHPAPSHWLVFNLRQLLLVIWTVVALVLLVQAVGKGLLEHPEMQLVGNGSTSSQLQWFADRTDGTLPVAGLLSLPLRAYQAAMLVWALWLAYALLTWLRWGYAALTTDGGLRSRPRPEKEKDDAGPAAPAADTKPEALVDAAAAPAPSPSSDTLSNQADASPVERTDPDIH